MSGGCFSANGTGKLAKIIGLINRHSYLVILKENLQSSAHSLKRGTLWIFQQDKDHKRTAKKKVFRAAYASFKLLNPLFFYPFIKKCLTLVRLMVCQDF